MATKARALMCLSLVACAASQQEEPPIAKQASAIIAGTASDESQDSVVLIMSYDALQLGGGTQGCTGVMLTPRLVLTARHCVADTDGSAICSSEGKALSGGKVKQDLPPASMYVFSGKDRPNFIGGLSRASRGIELYTNGATTICNNDIAMLLLDRPLEGSKIAQVRLDSPAVSGEKVIAVGWGITDTAPQPRVRQQRSTTITSVGPASSLGPTELKTGEATCQGDSGGPVFSESGAVLGVLSRGGNGTGNDGAAGCIGSENVYTGVAGHADFLRSGYEKAGQVPWLEGEPVPPLKALADPCESNVECLSSFCDTTTSLTCTQDCSSSACPSGFACTTSGEQQLCTKAPEDEDGCNTHGRSANGALFALFAVTFGLFTRRDRRR